MLYSKLNFTDFDMFLFYFTRFSSITINLGPTFLSGALAANTDETYREPSCPIIQVPFPPLILFWTYVLWSGTHVNLSKGLLGSWTSQFFKGGHAFLVSSRYYRLCIIKGPYTRFALLNYFSPLPRDCANGTITDVNSPPLTPHTFKSTKIKGSSNT